MKKINRIGNFLFYLPLCFVWAVKLAWTMAEIGFWPFDWELKQEVQPLKSYKGKYPFKYLWRKFEE